MSRLENIAEYASFRPDSSTQGFVMQQTMMRVKDPRASLDFYIKVLGMRLLQDLHFEEYKFSLYFVGYANEADIPQHKAERMAWCMRQAGTVELTHNWGTESDPDFKGYHHGNSDPQGFGHIGISVPDLEGACERFEQMGVAFRKKPNEGGMKGIAFLLDPDGYSVEVVNPTIMQGFTDRGTV
eukprot:CAMPEP_0113936228 /NCGR_PEP_ID=MMETSP1339-20121228/3185_1 /TAXON_ID=94617 /ORGANISM="Fibrocapsa japonica" /LENGTH=182 /DNA_ID=CAMNT_0000938623 /DNA_START=71 /DNA_END=619 /DNA_ORIENTATION=+ /assembly_acc=CAM_ASM_000762